MQRTTHQRLATCPELVVVDILEEGHEFDCTLATGIKSCLEEEVCFECCAFIFCWFLWKTLCYGMSARRREYSSLWSRSETRTGVSRLPSPIPLLITKSTPSVRTPKKKSTYFTVSFPSFGIITPPFNAALSTPLSIVVVRNHQLLISAQ